ncbi:MAG: HAMP domain-containing histidine kinase [bacterium]|nr:HAMP domain-containing histidine kinase [bacterium]
MNTSEPISTRSGYRRSIATRVVLIVVPLAAILSAVPPFLSALQMRELSATIRQRHQAIAAKLAQEVSGWTLFGAVDMMIQSFRHQISASDMVFARLINRSTYFVEADADDALIGTVLNDPVLTNVLHTMRSPSNTSHFVMYHATHEGHPVDAYVVPVFVRGVITPYVLHAGFSLTQLQVARHELFMRVIFSVIFSSAVAITLLLLLRSSVTRPILRLASDVLAIAEHRRERVQLVGNDDELTFLANSFNKMLDDLRAKEAVERQVLLLEKEITDRKSYLNQLRYFSFWLAHDLEKHLVNLPALDASQEETQPWLFLRQYLGETCDRLKTLSRETETISASIAHAELFDLVPIVRDTVAQFRLQHPDVLVILTAPSEPILIKGDSYLLHACLNNLLSNARDATAEVNRSPQIAVRLHSDGMRAILAVTDNGCGMDLVNTDLRQRIFMPFFSTKGRQSDQGRLNQGLGLHFVNEVVVSHGGVINVESSPGVGSTFELSLPLAPANNP